MPKIQFSPKKDTKKHIEVEQIKEGKVKKFTHTRHVTACDPSQVC